MHLSITKNEVKTPKPPTNRHSMRYVTDKNEKNNGNDAKKNHKVIALIPNNPIQNQSTTPTSHHFITFLINNNETNAIQNTISCTLLPRNHRRLPTKQLPR